jgi:hypothetical protein
VYFEAKIKSLNPRRAQGLCSSLAAAAFVISRGADHRCYCKQQALLYAPQPPPPSLQPTPEAGDHGAALRLLPRISDSWLRRELGDGGPRPQPTTHPSTINHQLSISPSQASLDRPTTSQSSLCCPELAENNCLCFGFRSSSRPVIIATTAAPVSRPQGLGVLASSKHKGSSNPVLDFDRILSSFGHILHSQTSLGSL